MQNFDYMTPTRLVFGENAIKKLPEAVAAIGRRVLLTYGGGSIKKIGLYDRVKELLKDPIIQSMGQTLTGPTKLREMEETIAMKENREQAFGEMVGDMYKKEVEKKKALEEQNARKNQNEAGKVLQ